MMLLKRNILASYASQIYVTLVGIVMLPLYIKYMGAESYGLVGFFSMLQAWFNLLDMGLTPTMTRETARFRGGASTALSYRRLVRALEVVFLIVALIGCAVMLNASHYIAHNWLKVSLLSTSEVQVSVQLMAIIIALRWMCGLYRGAISGSECFLWLGGYNSVIATLRFVAVLPVLMFVGVTPTLFFTFQLVVAVIELAGLLIYAYKLFPDISKGQTLTWEWSPLKPVLKLSLTIAFTSLVWAILTQTDKLILSKILPLSEYGYFTMAVLVASGVMIITGPITSTILPRLIKLEAELNHAGLISLYRQSTQLVAVISGAAFITIAFFAEPLLWAWTGDKFLAHQVAPILILYSIANGILALGSFPYLLQYAKGDMRLHLIGNVLFVLLYLPFIFWAASRYGSVGAGYTWLVINLINFVAWLPLVHHKFEPGLNIKWYIQDVGFILLTEAIAGYCLIRIFPISESRLQEFIQIIFFRLSVFLAGALASNVIRSRMKSAIILRRYYH
jgi:O-antigen/teichoic acid export membrane protein